MLYAWGLINILSAISGGNVNTYFCEIFILELFLFFQNPSLLDTEKDDTD